MDQIKAVIFDVFGTTVDWRTTIVAELKALEKKYDIPPGTDWDKFAQEWRNNFLSNSKRISESGETGLTSNIDVLHRQLLDQLLESPEYSHIGKQLDDITRHDLVMGWHRLQAWPDVVPGLKALKKQAIVVGLSNGSLKALIDLAKSADLPWDAILSTDFFSTFKPNPKVYTEALRHLNLPPKNCVMVACHLWDLRAAAAVGMKTVYVPRAGEDTHEKEIKSKEEGGLVDYIVDAFTDIPKIVIAHNERLGD